MSSDRDDEDRIKISFEITRDVWDLLMEVSPPGTWQEIAAKALEAGLEQARTPTAMGPPSGWRG